MKSKLFLFISLICISFFINSCVEPFDTSSISYESILIVEGKLTNEYKNHQILLSRTVKIDSLDTNPEKNAFVYIIDNNNQTIDFSEIEDGKYQSNLSFIPESDKTYTLKIETSTGDKYSSSSQQLTKLSDIKDINISLLENNIGVETLNINVSSLNIDEEAQYYYYEYEETFKLIAPYWNLLEFEMSLYPLVSLKAKEEPYKEVCYKTEYSTGARVQIETNSLAENNVLNFNVRSLTTDDYRISHRYSILVKQYIQSYEAYTYHETLNNFSNYESVFSENQVGFLQGNIFNEDNVNEKVIGFFEINSVTNKRVFFNRDEYITTPGTSYAYECQLSAPVLVSLDSYPLLYFYERGYNYFTINDYNDETLNGPYLIASKECGDCTEAGGNVEKPEFWID